LSRLLFCHAPYIVTQNDTPFHPHIHPRHRYKWGSASSRLPGRFSRPSPLPASFRP